MSERDTRSVSLCIPKTLGTSSTVHDAAAEGKPSLLREVGVDGTAFASAEKDEVRESVRLVAAHGTLATTLRVRGGPVG